MASSLLSLTYNISAALFARLYRRGALQAESRAAWNIDGLRAATLDKLSPPGMRVAVQTSGMATIERGRTATSGTPV